MLDDPRPHEPHPRRGAGNLRAPRPITPGAATSTDFARQPPSGARSATALVASLLAAFSAAGIGAAATNPRIDEWYATLDKPSWTPPDGVFAPVWSVLYPEFRS
jgi:tryptophan-rich sensory protein